MIVEELLILDMGLALPACGESCHDWDRLKDLLANPKAFVELAMDLRVHPTIRMNLQLKFEEAALSSEGAEPEQWMRTQRLIHLYQTDPEWRERGEQLLYTTERIWSAPEQSSSASASV